MQNLKKTAYTPAELEIIMLDLTDILTTSGSNPSPTPDPEVGEGPIDDPNVDFDW